MDPKTHTYITTGKKENKFGIDLESAAELVGNWNYPGTRLIGLHMHIGSQITEAGPHAEAAAKVAGFFKLCTEAGHQIKWFNIGGGYGVNYQNHEAKTAAEFARRIVPVVKPTGCRLALEPGRFIMANAGVLITEVQYIKRSGDKRFVIVDAAMTDLIRPTLYGAFHFIWPVASDVDMRFKTVQGYDGADVVGGVCESGDFFAKDRPLPEATPGDLLSIFSTGAYGFVMSSTYNSRPRAVEVMVDGDSFEVTRRRETYEDLIEQEV